MRARQLRNPAQPRNYVLFLNGDFQLVSSYEEYYHEWFAHVPIATNGGVPRRVLVMGAGDAVLIRAARALAQLVALTFRGFRSDHLLLRASALTLCFSRSMRVRSTIRA